MNASRDPVKDWVVQQYREIFGDSDTARAGKQVDSDGNPTRIGRFTPTSPIAVAGAAAAVYAPRLLPAVDGNETATDLLTQLHGYQWPLLAVAAALCTVDVSRYRAHKSTQMLESVVRQTTGHLPRKVIVSLAPGRRAIRRATITLHPGTVIRPKAFDELTRAIEEACPGRGKWEVRVKHEAHKNRILITRAEIIPDTRSPRHKALQAALDAGANLKDAKVTVDSVDEYGVETGFKITFEPSMNSGARGFQAKVDEALASLAGVHESGRTWTTEWTPSQGHLVMRLVAAMPTRVDHPLALVDEDLRHLPYATGAADLTMFWDVSTSSNKPHCLIVGPTGGGKTSVIRTLLTEAARRGIPFVGVDPKMIELDGLEGYPGCGAIVYDALRAAMFVRALHTEMMARNAYIHHKKIEGSQLPLMIAVLDEFFILSGKWQRLAKTGDDETRELLKELDPLGAWADLAVLARSAGIRLLLGVQRPDASLFGGASGNARDNFGTRLSLGNLSQDGALMMWGDSTIGREVDTSVKGRGIALGTDGSPVDAQMWWTPNVDRHPNKWSQLSESEKAIIDGLQPAEAPEFTCYSRELAEFIESERALAKRAREHGDVPEPIVLGDSPVSTAADDDDVADAIPASAITEGMVVLIDDGQGSEVPVTVDAVTVIRDKDTGDVLETTLSINTGGRVKTNVHYGPTDVVFLPGPDRVPATV